MSAKPKTEDDLKHLCNMASVWAGAVLMDDYDPTDMGGEHPQNIKSCHQIIAQAFVGLLDMHPELKPRFRVRADGALRAAQEGET